MAILIKTDGSKEIVKPENGKDFSLKEMYSLLQCSMVQVIYLRDGNTMWIDEEGKFKEPLVPNHEASLLLADAGGIPGDFIAGLALVTAPNEVR